MSHPARPSNLRRLLALPQRERCLLFEAWWTLLGAATRLRCAPRRTVARALAEPPAPAPPSVGTSDAFHTSKEQRKSAGTSLSTSLIVLAVSRAAARHLTAMTCLPRALALQRMLATRGIPSAVRIGVRKESGGGSAIAAHAWVEVEGRAVGEPEAIAERFLPFLDGTD